MHVISENQMTGCFGEWMGLQNCLFKSFSKQVKCKKKYLQWFNQIVIMENTIHFFSIKDKQPEGIVMKNVTAGYI